jgi:hypothetical protein
MDAQAKQFLLEIGNQLDAGIFPKVKNEGFVMPGEAPRPLPNQGVEKKQCRKTKTRRTMGTRTTRATAGTTPAKVTAILGITASRTTRAGR